MDKVDRTKLVLVTGVAGAIGRAACRGLVARGHQVRGFDRVVPKNPDCPDDMRIGDLTDEVAVDDAVRDVEAIVHLAAEPDEADFKEKLLGPNVFGVYHILESARKHKVQRTILTSSGQVITGHDWKRRTIRVDDVPNPISHYGVTKLMAEGWGRYYSEQHGMSVIVVRPGGYPRSPEQWDVFRSDPDAQRLYFGPGDAGRFFSLCVEVPNISFAILFATSRPNGPYSFDLEPAQRVLGYEPQESWDDRRQYSEHIG